MTCGRGSRTLYCATWHTCLPYDERQRILDAWAQLHQQPKDTPRGPR